MTGCKPAVGEVRETVCGRVLVCNDGAARNSRAGVDECAVTVMRQLGKPRRYLRKK